MITPTPWLERKFEFNFPAGLYPSILERFRGTPARVEEMMLNMPEDKTDKRINNKWSIKEHIGHLSDLDELPNGRLDDFIAGKAVLRAADMSNKKTEDAHHNESSLKDLLRRFRMGRADLVKRLETVDDSLVDRTALHPRLQTPMRLVDMLYFQCEHDDHHLTRIRMQMQQ